MDGFEHAVTEILARHDLAGLDGHAVEYEREARELVELIRGAGRRSSGPAEVVEFLSAVMIRWFTCEDGVVVVTLDAAACQSAAADIWTEWRAAGGREPG